MKGLLIFAKKWAMTDLNRRHPACKVGTQLCKINKLQTKIVVTVLQMVSRISPSLVYTRAGLFILGGAHTAVSETGIRLRATASCAPFFMHTPGAMSKNRWNLYTLMEG